MSGILFKMAVIGAAGIGSQWAAWRLRIPAIALLLVSGFILGPVTGYLNPQQDFGDVYKPAIALAVAIILFEGGLTLNFKEIRETSVAVRRIVMFSGPLVWCFSALAAHYAAGLAWPAAIVLGAILVVTGPTVIMPLLRQAQLKQRPASLLRWEAIVNDPIGALFAVIAFETYLVIHGAHDGTTLVLRLFGAAAMAIIGGYVTGRLLSAAFIRGHVPEYLKAPLIFAVVLLVYALSNLVLEESGLLTVTVMGITLANSRFASLNEMRRFKETATILLVSGLFIMLTASLDMSALASLGWGAVAFVLLILFIVRPAAIFLATIGAGLDLRERTLISWIAPRGIVAVAVSGLFGTALTDIGVAGGAQLTALTFAVVASTILLHGFSLSPLASWLDLKSAERPGVLIVGGSKWAEGFASALKSADLPVLICDSNWDHIRSARLADIPIHFGEVLSEAAHHDIVFNRYGNVVAATDNDAYNSLVCTEFAAEFGRSHVFQIGQTTGGEDRHAYSFTVGGRPLFSPQRGLSALRADVWRGSEFQVTGLSDEFGFSDYLDSRAEDAAVICWVKPDGTLIFPAAQDNAEPEAGDKVIAFGQPPQKGRTRQDEQQDASQS
ncbi:MAG: sodium:proton antiporter [Ahrensia sp.]|nr:sodium:proton antiporter [Ahrensia sp.]